MRRKSRLLESPSRSEGSSVAPLRFANSRDSVGPSSPSSLWLSSPLGPSRLSHHVLSLGPSRLSHRVLSLAPSRRPIFSVVSLDDSVVCHSVFSLKPWSLSMTPSSISPPLLGRFIFSVRPSSLSLGLLSRSRVIGFVWKRQWSVSFIPEPTRVSQKDPTSSKPEVEDS
ncbi:hypothetical protein YC2023_102965 [Brassica napus]